MKIRNIIILDILIIFIGLSAFVLGNYYLKQYQITQDELRRRQLFNLILDGASVKPVNITIDYTKQISTGSPLVFGGSHSPPIDQNDAWNKIKNVGVTSIRKDLSVEYILPSTTTVNDYINNVNNIQNSENWDKYTINSVKTSLKKIKDNGMKTIGIMAYAPSWLTYNHTSFGVPSNWSVYQDIVKKIYELYRNELDYVEIWNEPDNSVFLDTTNSGNLSKDEAYNKIYYYASNAIREVDFAKNDGKLIQIGAPSSSNPRVSDTLQSLYKDTSINVLPNFISFHTYDTFSESLNIYNSIKKNYNHLNTPIFITEWNMNNPFMDTTDYKIGDKALIYTSTRLIDYLKNNIAGANYFALLPINTNNRGTDEKTMGFYNWINNKAELLPQARSWQLLSRDLGLGNGNSKIYDAQKSIYNLNIIGYINSNKQCGVAIVNSSQSAKAVTLNLKNFCTNEYATVDVYYASNNNDAKIPIYNGQLKIVNKSTNFTFSIPKETVMGVIFKEENDFNNLIHIGNIVL